MQREITPLQRKFLIISNLFIGLSGIICGSLFMIAPDGRLMGAADGGLLEMVQNFPLADIFFQNFFWIGLVMLFTLGIPSTVAAIALLRNMTNQYLLVFVAARLLILFCIVEVIFMPNFLVPFFMILGIVQVIIVVRIINRNRIRLKK